MYLSLPFPENLKKKKKLNLKDLFIDYVKEETPEGTWSCEKCQSRSSYTKKMDLWKAPNILLVHLKRFRFDRKHGMMKIENLVDFPLGELDLRDVCLSF